MHSIFIQNGKRVLERITQNPYLCRHKAVIMDSFGVIFLISVGGYILFRIIRSSMKKEYRDTIKRYRDEYPHAYLEHFPKDTLYDWDLAEMSFSDLSSRASLNEWTLKSREKAIKDEEEKKRRAEYERRQREEEERRKKAEVARQAKLEAERKQREIDFKYDRLVSKYPNGIRIYKREHPESSTREKIITVSTSFFEAYEDKYQRYLSYVNWKKGHDEFSSKAYKISKDILPNCGRYYYAATVKGKGETGLDKDFKFEIWQFFFDGFCLSDEVDYTYYPSYKEERKYLIPLKYCQTSYNDSTYEKIFKFIDALEGPKVVITADCGFGDNWKNVEQYHFGGLISRLQENEIPISTVFNYEPFDIEDNTIIIVVELISNNSRLKDYCELLLSKYSEKRPRIAYISLEKEYDEAELKELNARKEREKKEAEERTRREQEERERREREEAERRAREAREAEERRQREEAARRAREEKARLNTLAHTQKNNAWEFRNYLTTNGIRYLYHFTDRRNLDSIRRNGGLYSWYYCVDHDIDIPYPGGGEQSRSLDRWHGLQDYVRLSFCDDHPMAYRLKQDGYNLVLLRIKIDVAFLEETLFSDINAADGAHHHGKTIDDLKRVDLNATQQHYVSSTSPIFKKHQAEVLVKTFIPLEYIDNIDNPMSM